jgi:hypothetical protein
MHKLILKYVKLTSSNCNNNRSNRFRKINKYRFKLIKNKKKQFYKAFAIFNEKKITKLKESLFYLKEDRSNLFVYRKKFIASI